MTPGRGVPFGPEEELALLEHLARSIADFVLVTDLEGRLTWVNDAVLERLLRIALVFTAVLSSAALWWPLPAAAARVKEVASVQGVRSNPLQGLGLVIGLDGTGDQTTQAPYTAQSLQLRRPVWRRRRTSG